MFVSRTRSILKTISWRVVGTLDTIALGWFITGDPTVGLKVGGLELITKFILYYIHERLWIKNKYGTKKFILFGIILILLTGIFLAFINNETNTFMLMIVLFLNGLGMGLFMAPNMRATLSLVSRDSYATFSAFLNLVRNVATAVGQAVSTGIITGIMLLNGTEVELSEISAKSGNSSLNDSFLFGWKVTFLVLSLVTLIGLFASIKVKSKV